MPTNNYVSPEMRKSLTANRQGKLSTDQWKEIVTEPLITVLLLMVPIIFVLGLRLLAFGWMVWITLAALLVGLLLFRAMHYARIPIHRATLYAGQQTAPSWKFWKATVLHRPSGEVMRFSKSVAPHFRLEQDRAYLVYYLRDAGRHVLLSLAPADHPEAELWQPTEAFQMRFQKRGGRPEFRE